VFPLSENFCNRFSHITISVVPKGVKQRGYGTSIGLDKRFASISCLGKIIDVIELID